MNKLGLLVTLQAKPGKEAEVEAFLRSAGPLVASESGTTHWFAFRLSPGTFGIFDTFPDESARAAHVGGEVAKALFARAGELLATAPEIQRIDLLAEKPATVAA